MSKTVKAAVITGICTLIVGIFGGAVIRNSFNNSGNTEQMNENNISIYVNGETITMDGEEIQNTLDQLQAEHKNLENDYNDLKIENDRLRQENDTYKHDEKNLLQVELRDSRLILNGSKINIEEANSVAVVNNKNYYSEEIINNIVEYDLFYDTENEAIFFGEKQYEIANFVDVTEPYESSYYDIYTEISAKTFKMSGKEYTNGFACPTDRGAFALFNLDGKYSQISFTYGHIDETYRANGKFLIYADGILKAEISIAWDDLPKEITVPIDNCQQLRFECLRDNTTKNSYYGFANVIIE